MKAPITKNNAPKKMPPTITLPKINGKFDCISNTNSIKLKSIKSYHLRTKFEKDKLLKKHLK